MKWNSDWSRVLVFNTSLKMDKINKILCFLRWKKTKNSTITSLQEICLYVLCLSKLWCHVFKLIKQKKDIFFQTSQQLCRLKEVYQSERSSWAVLTKSIVSSLKASRPLECVCGAAHGILSSDCLYGYYVPLKCGLLPPEPLISLYWLRKLWTDLPG